jgi:hypothetical protein
VTDIIPLTYNFWDLYSKTRSRFFSITEEEKNNNTFFDVFKYCEYATICCQPALTHNLNASFAGQVCPLPCHPYGYNTV